MSRRPASSITKPSCIGSKANCGCASIRPDEQRAEASFRPSARNRRATASEIMGTARRDEPCTAVGRTGAADRGAGVSCTRLWLVHRGLRHRGSERGKGAARRISVNWQLEPETSSPPFRRVSRGSPRERSVLPHPAPPPRIEWRRVCDWRHLAEARPAPRRPDRWSPRRAGCDPPDPRLSPLEYQHFTSRRAPRWFN